MLTSTQLSESYNRTVTAFNNAPNFEEEVNGFDDQFKVGSYAKILVNFNERKS